MVISENELRARFSGSGEKILYVPQGAILTTAAKDYIREQGIVLMQEQVVTVSSKEKPEHMTHLRGDTLVEKTHPRIALRGKLDHLQAEIMLAQCEADSKGYTEEVESLAELLSYAREILGCEVKEEPFKQETLLGFTQQELREQSHHPERYFGVKHFFPDYRMGSVMVRLNLVRTLVRQTELAAANAFCHEGRIERPDLLQALNRMSSAVYIIECRHLAAMKQERGEQSWMKNW